jgi:hypothetical protein
VTWGNAGPHSAEPSIPDKDEVPGSSPGRPTPYSPRSDRVSPPGLTAFEGTACFLGPRWGRALSALSAQGPPGAGDPRPRSWSASRRHHAPDDLRAACRMWGNVTRTRSPTDGDPRAQPASSGSARQSNLAAARAPPTTTVGVQADASARTPDTDTGHRTPDTGHRTRTRTRTRTPGTGHADAGHAHRTPDGRTRTRGR